MPEERFDNSRLAARNIFMREWASAHEKIKIVGFDKMAAISLATDRHDSFRLRL